jgi:hypothetical protein
MSDYDVTTADGTRINAKVTIPSGPGASYLVYTALLTQIGTGAPVATVIENTIGVITFSYDDVGQYHALSAGLFTEGKTVVFLTDVQSYGARPVSASSILLLAGTGDDQFLNASIEIRVYP